MGYVARDRLAVTDTLGRQRQESACLLNSSHVSETLCITREQQEVTEMPPGTLKLMILVGEGRGGLSSPARCSDCCMRTTKRKVLEAEELELGESSSIRVGDEKMSRTCGRCRSWETAFQSECQGRQRHRSGEIQAFRSKCLKVNLLLTCTCQ